MSANVRREENLPFTGLISAQGHHGGRLSPPEVCPFSSFFVHPGPGVRRTGM